MGISLTLNCTGFYKLFQESLELLTDFEDHLNPKKNLDNKTNSFISLAFFLDLEPSLEPNFIEEIDRLKITSQTLSAVDCANNYSSRIPYWLYQTSPK